MESQEVQIETRVRDMPKPYRNMYKTAMRGRSVGAATRSFCLECVGWQREEIKHCTDLGCPLYPYRSLRRGHRKHPMGTKDGRKSKKSNQPTLFPALD